jgi:hypothetical protein
VAAAFVEMLVVVGEKVVVASVVGWAFADVVVAADESFVESELLLACCTVAVAVAE